VNNTQSQKATKYQPHGAKWLLDKIIGCNYLIGFFAFFIGLYTLIVNVKTSVSVNAPLLGLVFVAAVLFLHQIQAERETNKPAHTISSVASIVGIILWLWLPTSGNNVLVQWNILTLSSYYLFWVTTCGQPILLFIILLFLLCISLTNKPQRNITKARTMWFYLTPVVIAGLLCIYAIKLVQLGYFYHFMKRHDGNVFEYQRQTMFAELLEQPITACERPTFYVTISGNGQLQGYCPPGMLSVKGKRFSINPMVKHKLDALKQEARATGINAIEVKRMSPLQPVY